MLEPTPLPSAGDDPAQPAPGRPKISRRTWALVALSVVAVALAAVVVILRPGGRPTSAAPAPADPHAPARVRLHDAGTSVLVLWSTPATAGVSSFTVAAGPVGQAQQPKGETGPDVTSFEIRDLDPGANYCFTVTAAYAGGQAVAAPQTCTSRTAPAGATAPPVSPPPRTSRPSTAAPASSPAPTTAASSRSTAAPAVRTRIVSPAGGARVGWPFQAKFTVSPADAAATDTVLALLICVAGKCYLDGRLDISGGSAAPYSVRLGATRPEGVGVTWQVRLDRLATSAYDDLVAERNAAIADGTWGDRSTPMSALNPGPVSAVPVVKNG